MFTVIPKILMSTGGGVKKRYRVAISWKSVKYFDVDATSKDEAEGLAEARALDSEPDDYWESSETVEEVELLKRKTTKKR